MAVLFDWSSSFRDDHWNYTLNYAKAFVERLGISSHPKGTHVSMIGYSSSPQVVFNFKVPQNMIYITERLRTVTRQAGYRRPDRALDLARTDLFTASGGARQGAKRVILSFSKISTVAIFNFYYQFEHAYIFKLFSSEVILVLFVSQPFYLPKTVNFCAKHDI